MTVERSHQAWIRYQVTAVFVSLIAAFLVFVPHLAGCSPIEEDPPVDDAGNPLPRPEPYDSWLEVVAVNPQADVLSTSPVFEVEFSDYIDDDSFQSFGFALARSGGLQTQGLAQVHLARRSVIWRPIGELRDGLLYRFQFLASEDIRSVSGAPIQGDASVALFFEAREDATSPRELNLPEGMVWSDIEPLLADRCGSCHKDPQWGLNPLSYDSLLSPNPPTNHTPLVRPFDPGDSLLLQKILPHYPLQFGTIQPPPWSDQPSPLPQADIERIEAWIREGALFE